MADGGDGFVLDEKVAHEADGRFVHTKRIRVKNASREDEAVEFGGGNIFHSFVHGELIALLIVIEALDLAALQGDEEDLGACVFDGVPRFGQFHLFEAVSGEKRDFLSG